MLGFLHILLTQKSLIYGEFGIDKIAPMRYNYNRQEDNRPNHLTAQSRDSGSPTAYTGRTSRYLENFTQTRLQGEKSVERLLTCPVK